MKKKALRSLLWISIALIVSLSLTAISQWPANPATNRVPGVLPVQPESGAAAAVVAQVEPTQGTAVPVTGTATSATLIGGPWTFLMAAGLIAILLMALSVRSRPENSPSVASKSTYAPVSAASSPAAAPATAPEIPASAASTKPEPMRYEYKKTTATIPPSEAPPFYDHTYTITVDVDRPATSSNGVLFAMGSAQDGYGMYMLEGKLIYQQSIAGAPQLLIGIIPAPLGHSSLQFRFLRTGPNQGTGSLYINGRMVNSAYFGQTLSKPPTEGLDIGYDAGSPLSDMYIPPYPFLGTLNKVVFEIEVA